MNSDTNNGTKSFSACKKTWGIVKIAVKLAQEGKVTSMDIVEYSVVGFVP